MREVVTNLFTNADGTLSVWRVAVVVVVSIGLWRAVFLLAQAAPSPLQPAQPVSASVQTRASWFPSKAVRVQRAVQLVKDETDLILSQSAQLEASAGLARARKQLETLVAELNHKPEPPAPKGAVAALTFAEIDDLLHLLDLDPELHQRIARLVAARIEEKTHERS